MCAMVGMYILENIDLGATAVFLPLLILGGIGGLCFQYMPWLRQNQALKLLGIALVVMGTWRLLIPLSSKRYMMPLMIPVSVFAMTALVAGWHLGRERRIWRIPVVILAIVFVTLSVGKYMRVSGAKKWDFIQQQASVLQNDFRKNGYRNAVVISNSSEVGRIYFYSGIPGQHFLATEPDELVKMIGQMLSQYDCCYISLLVDQHASISLEPFLAQCTHSFQWEPVAGNLPAGRKQKQYRLFKIVSHTQPLEEGAEGILRNPDFQIPGEQEMDPRIVADLPSLAPKVKVAIPREWRLTLGDKRGRLSAWEMDYAAAADGRMAWHFKAKDGGVAVRSQTRSGIRDYWLGCRAAGTGDASLYFFLYGYDARGRLTEVQNVGYMRASANGRIDQQLVVRGTGFQKETSFFHIGFIATGESVQVEYINLRER